jgi:hypothetical protein
MKIARIIAIAFSLAPLPALMADSPAPPVPWVTTSESGDYLFKMVPPKWRKEGGDYVIDREAFGVAYKISGEGEFQEMWRTQGWYTFKGYLSDDGLHFVRFGPWASDQKEHSDLALAFYERGKLIKQYEVRELIKKPDLLEDSVSHYRWQPEIQSVPNGFKDGSFHLVMIDKTTFTFDRTTGEILKTDIDEGAKSSRELRTERESEAEKKGRDLFEASDFRKSFEEQFHLSHIEAGNGKIYGVYFEDPEWSADLTPIKRYSQPCEVSVVFPIKGDKKIEVSIEPKEIDAALDASLSHPFVMKRFADGGATGLRLRITGDRLHWNSPELEKFLAKFSGAKPTPGELRNWAYLIIDAKEPRFTSIYFNTKTKELIYEDGSNFPYEPILLDSTGKRTEANRVPGSD